MFLRYLPFTLMGESKIYGAVPPLYGLDLGKDKVKFFRDKVDFVDWVRNSFSKEYIISDYNTHKPLSKNGVLKLLVDNMDYVKLIRHVSSIFAIDPYLLELIIYNKDESFKKFKSVIEKAFPYTTVSMQNNNIMIRGLVGSNYQTIFFNDMLLHECKPIIDIINKSDKYYLLNNKRASLYDVMIAFDKYTPSNISRYKGLGEMPPELLGKSTIIPGMGRTLYRYTMEDAKKELEYLGTLQGDKGQFIQGAKVTREDIV